MKKTLALVLISLSTILCACSNGGESSSSSQSSTASTQETSSSTSSEPTSTASTTQEEKTVLVGNVIPSGLLAEKNYTSKSTTAIIGKNRVTFNFKDMLSKAATSKNPSSVQFAKGTHDSYVSTIEIKAVLVHVIKLSVYGYNLAKDENGITLVAEGVSFTKETTEVTGENNDACYVITYTCSDSTKEVDLKITNNAANARYLTQIDFEA